MINELFAELSTIIKLYRPTRCLFSATRQLPTTNNERFSRSYMQNHRFTTETWLHETKTKNSKKMINIEAII